MTRPGPQPAALSIARIGLRPQKALGIALVVLILLLLSSLPIPQAGAGETDDTLLLNDGGQLIFWDRNPSQAAHVFASVVIVWRYDRVPSVWSSFVPGLSTDAFYLDTGDPLWVVSDGPQSIALPLEIVDAALLAEAFELLDERASAFTPLPTPVVVFLTASDAASRSTVAMGRGPDRTAAVAEALAELRTLWPASASVEWLKVDLVTGIEARSNLIGTPLGVDRSLFGIALDWDAGLAFLPEELVANALVDEDEVLRLANIADYLALGRRAAPPSALDPWAHGLPARFDFFRVEAVFTDGREAVPLYRGHRLFDETGPAVLLAAAEAAADYLTRSVLDDGRFVYIYRPDSDTVPDAYNIVRHAGTVYAMAELYGVSGDPDLRAALTRAIDYLVSQASAPCPAPLSGAPARCVFEDGRVKLGANALAVLGLVEYTAVTGDESYLPVIRELAEWIAGGVFADGRQVHFTTWPGGTILPSEVRFYPGEAMFALARLHKLDEDPRWLDVAEMIAHHIIEVRDAGLATDALPSDHWFLYGASELYPLRPDPLYLDHAMRMTLSVTSRQQLDPVFPDLLGSYGSTSSTNAATRSEGLCAAHGLAREAGLAADAARILAAVELGLGFQLQTQYRPEGVLYFRDPQRPLGGFHQSLTNLEIRNDYVQHNTSSLLCGARLLGDLP